ncbi:MAG: major capsid protein [Bacteroidales bacterium]
MSYKHIDFLNANGQSEGEIAKTIATQKKMDPGTMRPFVGQDGKSYVTVYAGGDPNKKDSYKNVPLNTNATLRRDEWKQLDDAVLKVAKERLGGIQDLVDNGLTYNLGNAMGTTVLEWHRSKTDLKAQLSMDGLTRGEGNRPVYDTKYLPIPIIHVDYEINTRELEASRKLGNPISTDAAEEATRTVQEYLEDMLFTDTNYSFGGGEIKSYINYEDRVVGSLNKAWDDSGTSASQIVDDIMSMKQASIDNKHYGPWMVYIPTAYEVVMDEDYDTSGASTQTIRDRILKIGGIKDIKVIDRMPSDTVLMVELSTKTVRLVRGMGIQNVEWMEHGRFITKYKVMTIQVPHIRSDKNGTTGIIHYTV